MREEIRKAHLTRFWLTMSVAVADHLIIGALVLAAAWSFLDTSWYVGIPAIALAAVGLGRQLRALECLVHEGSHFNWTRHHRRVNDVLARLFAGVPTGARMRDYRNSHLQHHGKFATELDPDMNRYVELNIESVRRRTWLGFISDMATRLPRYEIGWLRALSADPTTLILSVVWGVAWAGLPALLILGPQGAGIAVLTWALGYALVLPVIRFLGEASEHVYIGASSEFDATVSNLGWGQRFLIHPHGDGYHTVHHMWPGVPHHSLRRLHRALLAGDPEGYGRKLRLRTRLLQDSHLLSADG